MDICTYFGNSTDSVAGSMYSSSKDTRSSSSDSELDNESNHNFAN